MSATDRDELAEELFRERYGRAEIPESFDQSRSVGSNHEVANAILASDWLAAHDARVREQAAREALLSAADEWEALVQREKPPIRGSLWLRKRAGGA